MTEEEYFRKYYPDSCYGDRPLSPYWDFFQEGVEFGERQSEKRIEELEKENIRLAQHIVELQRDKGELVDKERQAKELLNACIIKAIGNVNPSWSELITDIEQFLKGDEKCQDQSI